MGGACLCRAGFGAHGQGGKAAAFRRGARDQALKSVQGRSLFSHWRKLLGKDQQFAQKAGEQQARHRQEQLQHLLHKAGDMVGQKVRNPEGSLQQEVDAWGMLRETRDGMLVMRFFSENFLDAVAARRLIPVRPRE